MNQEQAFAKFKTNLELDQSYQQIISDRHKAVRTFVENNLPSATTQLIGSLQRQTRITPLEGLKGFDIDILVQLYEFTGWNGPITQDRLFGTIEDKLTNSTRYERMGPETDRPVITIPYADGSKIELVPAALDKIGDQQPTGRAFWVVRAGRWVRADYNRDAEFISNMNNASDGNLVPVIKMLKAWRRKNCPQLTSYHLEVLAAYAVAESLQYWRAQGITPSFPALVRDFFILAKGWVMSEVKIPNSLSEAADCYLSDTTRQSIRTKLESAASIAFDACTATDSKALQLWQSLFGDLFPIS